MRQRLLLDFDWKFHKGDIPMSLGDDHLATYLAAKAGGALGAAKPDFDDGDWTDVRLPHDWVVENPFDSAENLDQGYKARGVAWYRRTFRLEPGDDGNYLALEFDGIGAHCTVWLNGQLLRRHFCGYIGFRADISDVAAYGDHLNTLVVRVDATEMEGWWYEGAGIYRHVWLIKANPVHVAQYGAWVNPLHLGDDRWDTRIETTVENTGRAAADFTVVSTVCAPDGAVLGALTTPGHVEDGAIAVINQNLPLTNPQRWSPETPVLYSLRTEILRDGAAVDNRETTFGYRTLRFDAEQGFFLNDQPVKLYGTCNHQDHAGVGVAVPDSLQEFRIRRLREMGGNFYRCAHNPPAPALLDACDRQGMLVMDENRHFSSAPDVLAQLETMILRDRNHPSIIFWSLFNEEMWQGTAPGGKMARTMARLIKSLDTSRAVTAAMNGGTFAPEGAASAVDVMGINYAQTTYDEFHALYPEKPIIASENGCTFSTRGEYTTSRETFYFDSYDRQWASWGNSARDSMRLIAERPFVMGISVWTGFEYRGEPSPYEWPCINSHWGILDTCGFPKDSYYLHQAMWTTAPMVHILPHWNWPGKDGQLISVMCLSNCDSVELFLNGRSLGRKAVDLYTQPEWEVAYQPGALQAVAYRGDDARADATVSTTGEAVALRLIPDRASLRADLEDTMPVTACAVDADGRVHPLANHLVTFAVDGPGEILGVGNGDPTCHEPDKANARSLFHGLAQLILRATDAAGTITLTATAPGLQPARVAITAASADRRPFVPAAHNDRFLWSWRMSPLTAERPDPNMTIAAHDMNTWVRVEAGNGPQAEFNAPGYAIYRTELTLPANQRESSLVFTGILGTAEVYLNGKPAATKATALEEPLTISLPSGLRELTLSVLIHSNGTEAGITKPVKVTEN